MNQGEKELPKGWKWGKLGDYINLSNGKSITKKELGNQKIYPVYGSSSILGRVDKALVFEDTICIGRVGACGVIQIAKAPCWISDNAMYVSYLSQKINFEYLIYLLSHLKLERFVCRTSQPSISQTPILEQEIPLPPLPVQEQIVQILQKADEIRRKRQEAVAIADSILPAIFNEMFGDSEKNSNWVERSVGSILREEPANGKSPSKKKALCSADVLTLTAVRNGCLNLEEKKHSTFDVSDVSKYYIKNGDAFVVRGNGNIDLMGRIALYDGNDVKIVYPDTLIRLRFNNELVLSEFMQYLWDTQIIRNQIVAKSKTTNGTNKINQDDVKSITFSCPPIDIQHQFLLKAQAYVSCLERENNAKNDSHALFSSLLYRAFTGELTAEWEAANAEQIATKQKFYQRLPQLVILSFLKKKINRIQRQKADTAVLVTALMKYVFLLQMEGTAKRRLYQFIPYHYGPFAKELYTDLETLQEQGLITVDDSDEDKTCISLLNSKEIEAELAELPDELQADIEAIINSYGDLDLTSLLATVYEKYPAYAKKSKLKQRKPKPKKEEN